MDEEKLKDKITLTWSLSTFVGGLENVDKFCEVLDPNDFIQLEFAQSYWSFPERVISMRQMLEWKRSYREENFGEYLQQFTILENHVHDAVSIIIEFIHRWAQLNHFISHPKLRPFREFIDKHWSNLRKYSQATNVDVLNRKEMRDIVEDFEAFLVLAYDGYDITSTQLDEDIRQYYLTEDAHQRGQVSLEDINEFCSSVLLRIEYLYKQFLKYERIEGSNLGMLNLEQDVRQFLNLIENKPEISLIDKKFEASPAYADEVLSGIQRIADHICKRISFEMSLSSNDVQLMIDHIESIVDQLECAKRKKSTIISNYLYGSKCVACLILDNNTSIIAFSGFQDVPPADNSKGTTHDLDNQLVKHVRAILGITKDGYGDIFNKIAEADNSMLATLSAKVMRKLVRYEIDRHGQLSKRGPFIDELEDYINHSKELSNDERGILKSKYSCCERKILAFLADNAEIPKSKEAVLLVKYEPCLSCYGALQAWKIDAGILLETYFLLPYTK